MTQCLRETRYPCTDSIHCRPSYADDRSAHRTAAAAARRRAPIDPCTRAFTARFTALHAAHRDRRLLSRTSHESLLSPPPPPPELLHQVWTVSREFVVDRKGVEYTLLQVCVCLSPLPLCRRERPCAIFAVCHATSPLPPPLLVDRTGSSFTSRPNRRASPKWHLLSSDPLSTDLDRAA